MVTTRAVKKIWPTYFYFSFFFTQADKSVFTLAQRPGADKKKKQHKNPCIIYVHNNSHPLLATDYIEFGESIHSRHCVLQCRRNGITSIIITTACFVFFSLFYTYFALLFLGYVRNIYERTMNTTPPVVRSMLIIYLLSFSRIRFHSFFF